MAFTKITGDQERYVMDGGFSIVDDYNLSSYDGNKYTYCRVPDGLVHVDTFYKEVSKSGNGPEKQIPSMGCSIKWFK